MVAADKTRFLACMAHRGALIYSARVTPRSEGGAAIAHSHAMGQLATHGTTRACTCTVAVCVLVRAM